mmetsp:Transcript_2598/g.10014  ORF Transcript_2598/g.10014 Transcript_2598/m.10014 type:complete len:787 (-) Transcript_2598:50-2410(-)
MAGSLFKVLGSQWFFSPCEACPEELRGTLVRVASSDGKVLKLPAEAACVSGKMRTAFGEMGGDFLYPIPLCQRTVSKLSEYLKHHKDHPPGEITGSLDDVGNLTDIGVSRWDVAWVKCDKEMFFDLMLAAVVLDIPAMVHILCAQAAVMFRGKSMDKLRREFNMANDLDPEERRRVSGSYADAVADLEVDPTSDDVALFGSAILVSNLTRAAERNGIYGVAPGELGSPSVDTKSTRWYSWRVVILQDWTQLRSAPAECRSDRELLFAALRPSSGEALQYASEELRRDRALALEAARCRGEALRHASVALRADRSFMLEAVSCNGSALSCASDELRGDRDIILTACEQGQSSALQGATAELRIDWDFVLRCVELDPESVRYASKELLDRQGFALAAVSRCGPALRHLPARFRADASIVRRAIDSDPTAVCFAHAARREELGATLAWEDVSRTDRERGTEGVSAPSRACSSAMHPALQGPVACQKLAKVVCFSAFSTPFGNMGQANYTAANIFLEKLPARQRPEVDGVSLLWGAVGSIGMRWKAFASADVLNASPELLLTVSDASKILRNTCCTVDVPAEMVAANFLDEGTRNALLYAVEAGKRGGWLPGDGVAAALVPAPRARSGAWLRAPAQPQRKDGFAPPRTSRLRRRRGTSLGGGAGGAMESEHTGEALEDDRLLDPSEDDEPQEAQSGEERPNLDEEPPLGGWPDLVELLAQVAREPSPEPTPPKLVFVPGQVVELQNLQSKNGSRGTLIKQTACGKWKVRLESNLGVALLKDSYIRPLPSS